MTAWAVFIGGGLGALSRWAVALALGPRAVVPFPWATLIVNVAGCFVLGLLAALFAGRLPLSPPLRLGLTTGFLGGLTTFSTFGHETVRLLFEGAPLRATLNVAANVGLGLPAAALGVWLGTRAA